MLLLFLVGSIWSTFFLTLVVNYDTRLLRVLTRIKYKYRVKDNSIFRKILRFKDKEDCPLNYFKVIPIYIYLLLGILSLILLLVDIITSGLISNILSEEGIIYIAIGAIGVYVMYLSIILIWWGLVEFKKTKFTKEEKEELKKLRKDRKQNKK